MKKYIPLNSLETPRFAEIKTFMRLPNVKTTEDVDYAVIGVPFDTGTTYRPGARFGPAAIRDISSLIKPYNVPQRINVVDELSGVDYGDVPVIPGFIEDTYDQMVKGLTPIVKAGVIPICLGGDHSITLGELRAVASVHGPVALVHFDSHFDTIDFSKESFYEQCKKSGHPITSITRHLEVTTADETLADLLQVQTGNPLFYFHSYGYDDEGTPIEYSISKYRGDTNSFTFHLAQ